MNRKYTKELLQKAVNEVHSYRQLILKLGLKETGGNFKNIKERVNEFDIDISSWGTVKYRMAWNKGLTRANSQRMINVGYTAKEIFVKNSPVATKVVRNYLMGEPKFEHKCQICNNTMWLGKKIPLDLDHKNGNNRDNRRINLRFVCPNCHAQTETYRGKNINKSRNNCKVSDDELLKALKESSSIRKALMVVGLTPKGGNYTRVYKLIHENNLVHLK